MTLLCNTLSLGYAFLHVLIACRTMVKISCLSPKTGFTATTAAATLFRKMAATRDVAAMKLHNSQSGRYIPHCRRVFATTVAVPVFAAAWCGAKVVIRWRVPCFPPRYSVTNWRIFAHVAIIRQPFQLIRFSSFLFYSELCTLHSVLSLSLFQMAHQSDHHQNQK
jgi:hypothetical protein